MYRGGREREREGEEGRGRGGGGRGRGEREREKERMLTGILGNGCSTVRGRRHLIWLYTK